MMQHLTPAALLDLVSPATLCELLTQQLLQALALARLDQLKFTRMSVVCRTRGSGISSEMLLSRAERGVSSFAGALQLCHKRCGGMPHGAVQDKKHRCMVTQTLSREEQRLLKLVLR
jgi:hypothetical protein